MSPEPMELPKDRAQTRAFVDAMEIRDMIVTFCDLNPTAALYLLRVVRELVADEIRLRA